MKKFAFAALALAPPVGLAPLQAQAGDSVQGAWNVTSFKIKTLDDGKIAEPFGPQIRGLFIYGKTHYARLLTSADRVANTLPLKDEDAVNLFKSMFAYGGTYVQEGSRCLHFVSRRDQAPRRAWPVGAGVLE